MALDPLISQAARDLIANAVTVADNPACETIIRVKALEWEDAADWKAKTSIGWYGIRRYPSGFGMYAPGASYMDSPDEYYPTLDAAKAAAQADYDRRVRACLEPGQGWRDISSAAEGVEALITGYQYNDPERGRYYAVATHLNGYWYDDDDTGADLHAPTHYLLLSDLPPPPAAEEGR